MGYSITELSCLFNLICLFFLGEKGATGEDFDQKESSDRQHHRSFTVHATRGIKLKGYPLKFNY